MNSKWRWFFYRVGFFSSSFSSFSSSSSSSFFFLLLPSSSFFFLLLPSSFFFLFSSSSFLFYHPFLCSFFSSPFYVLCPGVLLLFPLKCRQFSFDHRCVFQPSILNAQCSMLNAQSSILNPQSSILNPRSSILSFARFPFSWLVQSQVQDWMY